MHILNKKSATSTHGIKNTAPLLFSNFYPTCTIENNPYAAVKYLVAILIFQLELARV